MNTSPISRSLHPRLAGQALRTASALWAAASRWLLAAALGLGAAAAPAAALPAADTVGLNGAPCSYATLGDALAAAASGDTVYIAPGTYNEVLGTLDMDLHLTAATADCTAADPNASFVDYEINGGGAIGVNGGLAYIAPSRTVTLTSLYLMDAQAIYGGLVYVDENAKVTLDHVRLADGQANGSGGLLYVAEGAEVSVVNGSVLYGGMAGVSGGALYLEGEALLSSSGIGNSHAPSGGGVAMDGAALLRLLHSNIGQLSPNTASNGGGLYLTGQSWLEMFAGGYVTGNEATAGKGGGIYASGDVTIVMEDSSRVYGNQASAEGGGIYAANGAAVTLAENSRVGGTLASDANTGNRGAGIFANNADFVLIQDSARVQHNAASLHGGGLYLTGNTPLTMTGGSVLSNTAGGTGGGLAIEVGSATLTGTLVAGNAAHSGGGISLDNNANNFLVAANSHIVSNTASADGGGIYTFQAPVIISDTNGTSRLANNHAGSAGGAVWQSGAVELKLLAAGSNGEIGHILVEGNTAGTFGGALYSTNDGDVTVAGSVWLTGNVSLGDGGGWYQDSGRAVAVGHPLIGRPHFVGNLAANGSGGGLYFTGVSSGPGDTASILFSPVISGNQADLDGGGLYMAGGSYAGMASGLVQGNLAGQDGGGVLLSAARLFVDNIDDLCQNATQPADHYCSEFRGNSATGNGGALAVQLVSELVLSNTAVISNTAALGSGIMSVSNGDQVEITNSLFAGNASQAVYVAADGALEVVHATFAGNGSWAIDVNDNGATFNLFNSLIWGNASGIESAVAVGGGCSISQNGVGGANTDPLFKTTGRGDYRLQTGSPAIDACSDGTGADLDGLPRPQDSDFDMGAFESGRPLVLFDAYHAVSEGGAGLTAVPLVVSLSETSAQTVTLDVEAVAGTALAGQDFNALSQTLVFAPGTLSQTVTLQVVGDTVYEDDETVSLALSNADHAELTATTAEFEIENDDDVPVMSAAWVEVVEGDSGLTPVTVTVSLSHASAFTATVSYSTEDESGFDDDSAAAGVDYEAASGTLVLAPGTTSTRLVLNIFGDELDEGDETLVVNLYYPIGAVIALSETPDVVVTILDDDGAVEWQLFLPVVVKT